jgi:hypothetical protein
MNCLLAMPTIMHERLLPEGADTHPIILIFGETEWFPGKSLEVK